MDLLFHLFNHQPLYRDILQPDPVVEAVAFETTFKANGRLDIKRRLTEGMVVMHNLISIAVFFWYLNYAVTNAEPTVLENCPVTGPGSIAPTNFLEADSFIENAVQRILKRQRNAVIISATANREAARWNLPVLLESIHLVEPAFVNNTIIFTSDIWAQRRCSRIHLDPSLCIYTDLNVSSESLVPSQNNSVINKSYWRIAFARMYGTFKISNAGASVLQVDVDTVFLKNPFALSEELFQHPESMAGMVDTIPFDLAAEVRLATYNAGFLYFPAITPKATNITNSALSTIWNESCRYYLDSEQSVTTNVLRGLARTLPINDTSIPQLLSAEKYLSFCSTSCGSPKFSQIKNLHQLNNLEKEMEGNSTLFRPCSKEIRKDWVFFHAACISWPDSKGADTSKAKGMVQRAIIAWARESRE